MEKKKRKIVKGKVENWKWKEGKWVEDFFFFFFLFTFQNHKNTKICSRATKMEIFYWEKAFHAGEKIRKNDFAPLRKIFLLRPWPGGG